MRTTEPIDGIHHYFSQPRARDPGVRLEQPPRVRRNFLTWAFFLAQVSAAELLLTGAAKAQDDELSENSANRPEASSAPLPDDAFQRIDMAEAQITAPPSSSIVGSQVTPHLDTAAQSQLLPLGIQTDQHTLPVGGAAGAGSSTRVGSGGSADNSLPTLLPEVGGGGEQAGPPAIDVNIGLSPLLGFELHIDTGGLISGVGLDLGNLLVGPLETVTGLVDSLVTDLGNLLNNDLLGLGELLDSSPLNLSELTGLTLTNGIAGLLQGSGATAEAHFSSSSEGDAPLIALSTSVGELSAPGLLSGGMINFPAVGSPAQLDVLYAQGQHTDYNIALRQDAGAGPDDATPAQSEIANILPEALAHEAAPPADSASALLSPLDDFIVRPSL